MKPAAVYARVSSEGQRERQTIDSQIESVLQFARDEGYSVPVEWIYRDEGYSGSTLVRPGLERVRDLAAEGQIETLLVHSPDRLSRKYAYQVLLIEEMGRCGVNVLFANSPKTDTPEGELLVQLQGMIAEYERTQIMERARRGKRHRAKMGSVSVLSRAPYGYNYVRKTEVSSAYFQINQREAEVVRKVFRLYTEDGLSLHGIACWLNEHHIPTRTGTAQWEHSTVWGILRNPVHKGTACYGKTEKAERRKITKPLRQKGGFSKRCSAHRPRPREEWIEIAVPAIVSEEIFLLAEERLEQNRRFSPRRTIEPTLLQGMLVCAECGYSFYRTPCQTTKRQILYYRCPGSDGYRRPQGKLCSNRAIRQDYLDDLIWAQVVRMLEEPELIRLEIERRIREIATSSPTMQRKEDLTKELARIQNSTAKLLDAYQEDLLQIDELRKRLPELRKRGKAIQTEIQCLDASAGDRDRFLRVADNVESFLARLRTAADNMDVTDRQKVLRLIVKEILVGPDTIRIKHSIPVVGFDSTACESDVAEPPNCLLRPCRRENPSGNPPRLRAREG